MAFALQEYANQTAAKYGIPSSIFTSLIQTESSGNISAISPKGAIGLTQLMPGTAEELGVNPYDPFDNMEGGAKYLSQQYKKFGNWKDALAAYNAGAGNVSAGQNYASKVLAGAGIDLSSDQFITDKIGDVEFGTSPPGEVPITSEGSNGAIGASSINKNGGSSFLGDLPLFAKKYGVILLLLFLAIVLIVFGTGKAASESETVKSGAKLAAKFL